MHADIKGMHTDNEIEVSVVMPCLNEEAGIGACLGKIKQAFARDGIGGEVIVADNGSTDRSREIALSQGAKVVTEPQPGYGAAYLRGLKEARGRFIIIGDSDNTYDFSDIPRFLEPLRNGYDFVIGSRFSKGMEKGVMPWPRRYIGNPVLSALFRAFFNAKISDVHCGMRAFSAEAYQKMKLRTLGMEFATEMLVVALRKRLKIREIAIRYYPREGDSKLKPVSDAWRHIRFMLLYCPLWLYFIPGAGGFFLGLAIMLRLFFGPVLFLGRFWDVHVMILGSMFCILSYQVLNIGVFARTFAIREKLLDYDKITLFFQRHFSLEKGIILGLILFLSGLAINILILVDWSFRHFGSLYRIKEIILSLTFLVIGLQTIFSSFFISLLFLKKR